MEGYAGSSAAASDLTPIAAPPPSANPAGLAALENQAAAAAAPDLSTTVDTIVTIISAVDESLTDVASTVSICLASASLGVASASLARLVNTTTENGAAGTQPKPGGEPAEDQLASRMRGGAGVGPVSAGVGRAALVGALSVPPTWALSPAIRQVAAALPATAGAPIVFQGSGENPYASLVLASLAEDFHRRSCFPGRWRREPGGGADGDPRGRGPGSGRSGAGRANNPDRRIRPRARDGDGPRHHPGSDARGDGHRDSACTEHELSAGPCNQPTTRA